MTQDEALAMVETRWWETATQEQIAAFQLYEDRLCCPFGVFHEAVEHCMGRPVYTHEFGTVGAERLRAEFYGLRQPATFEEIMGLIPEEKRIVIAAALEGKP